MPQITLLLALVAASLIQEDIRSRPLPAQKTRYWYRLPDGYDRSKKWPLVILLHGSFMDGRMMFTVMKLKAPATRFLIVAPDSPDRMGWDPDRGEEIVLASLRDARQTFSVDGRNIWLAGVSAGGLLTLRVAPRHADTFRGMVVGGAGYDERICNENHLSRGKDLFTYLVIGDRDPAFGKFQRLQRTLSRLGWKHLQTRVIPNLGHAPPPEAEVVRIFQWIERNLAEKRGSDRKRRRRAWGRR